VKFTIGVVAVSRRLIIRYVPDNQSWVFRFYTFTTLFWINSTFSLSYIVSSVKKCETKFRISIFYFSFSQCWDFIWEFLVRNLPLIKSRFTKLVTRFFFISISQCWDFLSFNFQKMSPNRCLFCKGLLFYLF
jgi:hypothetical protein